jgi:hypothetical protein
MTWARERLIRKPLPVLAVSYLASLLVITTTPLFFDPPTSSHIAIIPLLFDVLLAAYLAIHYLGLKSIFRLGAYFLAYVGLVSIPSGILAVVGSGHSYPSDVTNSVNSFTNNSTITWINNFDKTCLLVHGQSSAQESTGYYGLGYGGTGAQLSGDCHGLAQLTTQSYSSGIGSKSVIRSSIWLMDQPFYVPDHGQKTTRLEIGGSVFVSGWLARQNAGIGLYTGGTSLEIIVKLIGNAPCDSYSCYNSYATRYFTDPQSMSSDYNLPHLGTYVAPGYTYSVIVSFNVTSNTIGMGVGGISTANACFGYSSYCNSTPSNVPGFPASCTPNPSRFQACELDLTAITYSLTDI